MTRLTNGIYEEKTDPNSKNKLELHGVLCAEAYELAKQSEEEQRRAQRNIYNLRSKKP